MKTPETNESNPNSKNVKVEGYSSVLIQDKVRESLKTFATNQKCEFLRLQRVMASACIELSLEKAASSDQFKDSLIRKAADMVKREVAEISPH